MRRPITAVLATCVVVLTACATTVDESDSSLQVAGDTSPSTIPPSTIPVAGTATELLAEIAKELSQLNGQIAAEGDQKATLERIEGVWLAAVPEVEQQRPDLVGGMQTAIDMARTAVVRTRPADADKAYKILIDLIDRYTTET